MFVKNCLFSLSCQHAPCRLLRQWPHRLVHAKLSVCNLFERAPRRSCQHSTLLLHHATCRPPGTPPRTLSMIGCENDVSVANVRVCIIITTSQSSPSGVMPPSCGTSKAIPSNPSIRLHPMSAVRLDARRAHTNKHGEDEMSYSFRRWWHRHVCSNICSRHVQHGLRPSKMHSEEFLTRWCYDLIFILLGAIILALRAQVN